MDTFKYCVLIVTFAALVCVQSIRAAAIGASCTPEPAPAGDCTGQNVECIEGTCGCRDNYYQVNSDCTPKSNHGGTCSENNHCGNTLECYIPTPGQPGTCVCQDGNYYNGALPCVLSAPLTPTIQSYTSTLNSITVTWIREDDPNGYTSRYAMLHNGISTEVAVTDNSPVLIQPLNSATTFTISIIRYISAYGKEQSGISSSSEAFTKSNHGGTCSNNSYCGNSLECYIQTPSPSGTCVCQDGNYYNGSLPCVSSAPLTPTIQSYTSTLNSITVTWIRQDDPTGYTSRYAMLHNGISIELAVTDNSPVLIQPLNSATTYTISIIRYISAYGKEQSGISSPSEAFTKSKHGETCSNNSYCGDSLECYIPTPNQPGTCVCQDGNYYNGALPCVSSAPLKPTILSYTSTYNSITVTWTRQDDPTGYTSRYAVLLNGMSTEVAITDNSPVLIPSLNSGTTYTISIKRYLSTYGNEQSVTSSPSDAVTKSSHGEGCNSSVDCAKVPDSTSLECFGQTSKVCVCSSGTYYAGSLPCVSITRLVPTFDILSSGLNSITVRVTNLPVVDTNTYTDVLTAHLTPGNINETLTSSGNTVIDGLSQATVYAVTVTRTITFKRPQTTDPTQPQSYSTKVVYGSACTENGTCYNNDANCYGRKCLCNTGFYWNTSLCETISNLAPHTITNESVETTSAGIRWVESDKKAFVSGYRVDAVPTHQNDPDPEPVEVNGTYTNLIGLQPGTEYSVSVSARSTNEERVEYVAANSIRIFTKPASITGINEGKSNFTGPNIIIAFNPAVVKYTYYTVRLKGIGSDTYDATFNATNTNDIYRVTFPGVTSGNYYDITVVTFSDSVQSHPFTTRRRVMAAQASEVRDFTKGAITSRSVYVTWKRPNQTNGNMFEYSLEVLKNTNCEFRIVFNCTECPGNRTDDAMSNNCRMVDTMNISEANINDINHINEYNITGLDPITRYFLVAVAYTEQGRGQVPSNEVHIQTEQEAARAPKSIKSTGTTSNTITLVWDPETPRPGVTSYEILVYEKKEDSEGFAVIGNRTVLGYYNQSLVITDLSSYWQYNFSIQAYTIVPPRSPIVISETVTTNESAPTEVEYIETDKVEGKFNMVRVKWKCPKQKDGRNGVITSANLTYYAEEKTVENPKFDTTIYQNKNDCVWEEVIEVTPEYNYTFTVRLQNTYTGKAKSTNRPIPAGPPFLGPQVATVISGQSDSQTSVPVVLSPKALYDRMNGRVILTGVVVCKGNCPSRKRRQEENKDYYENFSSWKTSKSNDFGSPYRATTDDWIDDKKGENEVTFTVGNNASCDSASEEEFCNGQLPPGTTFNIYVFACTNAGCSETDKVSVSTKEIPTNIGLIAGAVGGVVAAIIIIIIVVLVVRYMRRPQTTKLDPEDTEEELIVKKRPTRICNFEKKVEEMHKDSNLLFSEEFEDINALSPKHPCVASETGGNKLKNRYVNILPFDHSRVKLLPTEEDEEETDYINGNYIPGYRSQREYIATQGPMTGTVNDFWRMIWEQNVPIIVMLSDLSEKGKPKVDRYYPENMEPVQYGDIIVEMTNFSPLNKYVIRIFKLQLGDEIRMVRHYFLPGWQDFGANLTSDDVINFLKSVRMEIKPNNQGPLCIHCSAGVGRTGTYITLDVFQQYIDEEDMNKEMDIFDFTMKMRNNRSYMIQTEKQYIFVHDTIKEMIIRKKKEMSERDHIYQNHNTDDNNVYENQAFEADPQDIYMNVDSTGKPTTAL